VIIELIQLSSTFALGLLIGSLLTEAMILVPYWRTMEPSEFLRLHHTLGPKLYTYFAPLTIIGTMLPMLTPILQLILVGELNGFSIAAGVLALMMLGVYFIYFKNANKSFETSSIRPDDLPDELARWASWHWLRVGFGLVAFAFSLMSLLSA